jgi:hypothetical protein
MNKRFFPYRHVSFGLHRGFSKKHQGEYVVTFYIGCAGWQRQIGKKQFFKAKGLALDYINAKLVETQWIEA